MSEDKKFVIIAECYDEIYKKCFLMFWNNENGWSDCSNDVTIYTENQSRNFDLPMPPSDDDKIKWIEWPMPTKQMFGYKKVSMWGYHISSDEQGRLYLEWRDEYLDLDDFMAQDGWGFMTDTVWSCIMLEHDRDDFGDDVFNVYYGYC